MTDHANELRRYARKIAHPAGDVPSVMLAAADEIERLAARLEASEKARDALRTKIEAMERQESIGTALLCVRCRAPFDGGYYCPACGHHTATEETVYALPGAQNIPEKLCYDSRWEISIDYVDGWNAAVDMMRGKSPSWHCPDCCIAFPFGAPKACPHDDSRCNKLLADAKESA